MKRIDLVKVGGIQANEHLVTTEVPALDNEPLQDGQVVIQIKASAINPVDWKMPLYNFFLPEKLPAALGCDVAGVIVKAASSVDSSLVGARVVAHLGASKVKAGVSLGAYAEQVVTNADVVAKIPGSMSFAQAASLPVGAATAEVLLNDLVAVDKGSWVLVWGASSSVGFNVIQLAKKRGLKPIAVASGKHEAMLKEIGADAFVDYRKDDVSSKVKEICGPDKLNGAIDCIGEQDTFSACADLVKALGDSNIGDLVVTTVNFGLKAPEGIKMVMANLGDALGDKELRAFLVDFLPELVKLKAMPIRSVKGDFKAETLQNAFELSKAGVSGEKVVIEWNE